MPIGSPDFGANTSTNPTSPSYDTGEDTTRLLMGGGANSRAGRWIFATGFEHDTEGAGPVNFGAFGGFGKCVIVSNGNQGTTGVLSATTWQGRQCLDIQTIATSGDERYVYKLMPWQNGRAGLEFFFNFPNANPVNTELKLEIVRFATPSLIQYRVAALVFKIGSSLASTNLYTDNNGTRTLLRNLDAYMNGDTKATWHYMKLVFDSVNNAYIRAYFDNLSFDLGGAPGFTGFSTLSGDRFLFGLKTLDNSIKDVWIDNVIITGDEP